MTSDQPNPGVPAEEDAEVDASTSASAPTTETSAADPEASTPTVGSRAGAQEGVGGSSGTASDGGRPVKKPGRIRSVGRWAVNGLFYVALRVAGIECSFAEVTAGAFKHDKPWWPPLGNLDALDAEKCAVVDTYLASVEADGNARYDRQDSKLRSLLATNALAFGLVGAFALPGKPLFFIVAVPLVISAALALRALGVHNFQTLSLTKESVSLPLAELKAEVFRGRLSAAQANGPVLDFMVDCFRAAHRYFVVGLIGVPVVYGLSTCLPSADPVVRVRVQDIDRAVVKAIQGAPGPQGAAGPPGERGPHGQPGPQGIPGPQPSAPDNIAATPASATTPSAPTPRAAIAPAPPKAVTPQPKSTGGSRDGGD